MARKGYRPLPSEQTGRTAERDREDDAQNMTRAQAQPIVSATVEVSEVTQEDAQRVADVLAKTEVPVVLESVLPELGLLPEHVAAHRLDVGKVNLITRGGVKLRWPDDIERAKLLTQSQKDGQHPGGKNPNSKVWSDPAEANASLAAVMEEQRRKGEAK